MSGRVRILGSGFGPVSCNKKCVLQVRSKTLHCTEIMYIHEVRDDINRHNGLRQHLPEYLKQVQAGEEVIITVHGKAIARIA